MSGMSGLLGPQSGGAPAGEGAAAFAVPDSAACSPPCHALCTALTNSASWGHMSGGGLAAACQCMMSYVLQPELQLGSIVDCKVHNNMHPCQHSELLRVAEDFVEDELRSNSRRPYSYPPDSANCISSLQFLCSHRFSCLTNLTQSAQGLQPKASRKSYSADSSPGKDTAGVGEHKHHEHTSPLTLSSPHRMQRSRQVSARKCCGATSYNMQCSRDWPPTLAP